MSTPLTDKTREEQDLEWATAQLRHLVATNSLSPVALNQVIVRLERIPFAAALAAAYQQGREDGEEQACERLRVGAQEHAEQLRLIAVRIVNSTMTNTKLYELLARPAGTPPEADNG